VSLRGVSQEQPASMVQMRLVLASPLLQSRLADCGQVFHASILFHRSELGLCLVLRPRNLLFFLHLFRSGCTRFLHGAGQFSDPLELGDPFFQIVDVVFVLLLSKRQPKLVFRCFEERRLTSCQDS